MVEETEYYRTLPRKRVGAGALLVNDRGELLVVKPNYARYWLVPGGVVEVGESPQEGCVREAREEVGLEIKDPKLLCIAYDRCVSKSSKGDAIHFLFFGGELSKDRESAITLQESEIEEHRFLPLHDALSLFGSGLRKRVEAAMDALNKGVVLYLEIDN